ncbi:unnamed protein product, partial [Symbiodinium sp. CCMP2456]
MGKDKSAKKNDGKKVKQAAKFNKAASKKDLKSKGKSDKKKKKKSSTSDGSSASGSSSEANPHLEEAKEHLLTVGMAFGLLLVCIQSPVPSICTASFRKPPLDRTLCRGSRKQKDLSLNNQKCHLRDITAPQLATILVGIVPVLTPNAVMKLGGDVVQVRKSLTVQAKSMQSAAGKHDQHTLETKMDMLKKESGAERLLHAEWEGLGADVRDSRLEILKAKMKEWVAQNQADLKELNKVQSSPLPKRGRSSNLRLGSSSDNDDEKSDKQGEAEASPEPGAKPRAGSTGKKKPKRDDHKEMLSLHNNADLFRGGRFGPRKEPTDKKCSPPDRVAAEKEPKTDDVLPWLLLEELNIKRFFASQPDLLALSALLRNEGFADSRHDIPPTSKKEQPQGMSCLQFFCREIVCFVKDSLRVFLTSAFDDTDDPESPSWCKAELGEEALGIFKSFSFRAKKNFDAFCAEMKTNK